MGAREFFHACKICEILKFFRCFTSNFVLNPGLQGSHHIQEPFSNVLRSVFVEIRLQSKISEKIKKSDRSSLPGRVKTSAG